MIQKEYIAVVAKGRSIDEGFEAYPYLDPFENGTLITSYFRSFGPGGRSVRPVVSNKRNIAGRVYTTMVEKESENSLRCTITRGFRHQIRAHLAWAGYPIKVMSSMVVNRPRISDLRRFQSAT